LSLKAKPEIYVEVQGHTDSSGDRAYNQKYPYSVQRRLRPIWWKRGFKERIYPTAYRQDRPIADNKTAKGRAMNRRVQTIPII
jgi:outer membrane protein OmpA-like peptidoglycan-associated protein